jgi:hypothetical protein
MTLTTSRTRSRQRGPRPPAGSPRCRAEACWTGALGGVGVGGSRPQPSGAGRPVRRGTWYGRPTDGALARPTIRPRAPGRGCHCRTASGSAACHQADPRSNRGQHLGRRSRNEERTLSRGGSREGSRSPITSRVTGFFGHQARKAVGLAGLIEQARSSSPPDRPPDHRGAIVVSALGLRAVPDQRPVTRSASPVRRTT